MPGLPQCLCVVWCPGGVFVVRGVGPYRRYCDEHFPCLGRRPGAPKWCGVGLVWRYFLWWAGAGGQGSTAFVEQILAVVDVPVIFSDKFQQSKSYMFLKEPPIQFIDRAGPPCCATETFTHSANVQKTGEIPQLLFLDKVDDMPVVVLKTLLKPVETPQVQFLDRLRYACCCAQDTAEARGDSTGAVLGQVEVCLLLCSRHC